MWNRDLLKEEFRQSAKAMFGIGLTDADIQLLVRRIQREEFEELQFISRSRRWYLCQHKSILFAGLFSYTYSMLIIAKPINSVAVFLDSDRDSAAQLMLSHTATRFKERAKMVLSRPISNGIIEMIATGEAKRVNEGNTSDRSVYEVDLGTSYFRVVYTPQHDSLVTLLPEQRYAKNKHKKQLHREPTQWLDEGIRTALTELVHEGKALFVGKINNNRLIYRLPTPNGDWQLLYCRRRKRVLGLYEKDFDNVAA